MAPSSLNCITADYMEEIATINVTNDIAHLRMYILKKNWKTEK